MIYTVAYTIIAYLNIILVYTIVLNKKIRTLKWMRVIILALICLV